MKNINCKRILSQRQTQTELLPVTIIVISSLLVPTGLFSAQPIQKTFAQQLPCNLSKVQPVDPINMNTAVFKTFAKTIHVEKEVYDNCRGIVPSVLDVSIFTELRENLAVFQK